MKILVTGALGQVGWELSRSLQVLGQVIAVDLAQLDFTSTDDLRTNVQAIAPDVIVNAAAYTAVDRAESELHLAHAINGTAVGVLGEVARELKALMIHYSTDYVFDGTAPRPYLESDAPAPINAYGRSKLAGELALAQAGPHHLILRTSWVFASRGQNFVKTVLRLAAERPQLRMISDQQGAPTWARNIADATAHLIQAAGAQLRTGEFKSGVVNLSSSGSTNWHEFACAIVRGAMARGLLNPKQECRIDAIGTSEYPTPAPRPANSRLDGTLVRQRFGLTMPSWQTCLDSCLDELVGTPTAGGATKP